MCTQSTENTGHIDQKELHAFFDSIKTFLQERDLLPESWQKWTAEEFAVNVDFNKDGKIRFVFKSRDRFYYVIRFSFNFYSCKNSIVLKTFINILKRLTVKKSQT